MKLRILQPGKVIAEAEVEAVTLPGAAGELTPMPGHDLLITPLRAGAVSFRPIVKGLPGDRQTFEIEGGMAEILKDAVTVFISTQNVGS